jgi:asparaginyl-tRNA synthetase
LKLIDKAMALSSLAMAEQLMTGMGSFAPTGTIPNPAPTFGAAALGKSSTVSSGAAVYNEDDSDAVKIQKLQAKLQELQGGNAAENAPKKPTMRTRTSVSELMRLAEAFVGKEVAIGGWIRTVRNGGKGAFQFVRLYDGTSGEELQLVVPSEVCAKEGLTVGACILATGTIVESGGRGQKIEMKPHTCRIVGACDPLAYPLAGKNLKLEYLRTQGHMRPRSMAIGAVTRIRNALAYGTHNFFQSRQFKYIHTPLVTGSDCEGAGEMFQVTTLLKDGELEHTKKDAKSGKLVADYTKDFFKKPTYLTVSGQLNAEIYATAMANVYTFGPTFRAENSMTFRHLAEFWMIEPEIAFADIVEDMDIAEAFLKSVIQEALDTCPADMEFLEKFEAQEVAEKKKELAKEFAAQKKKGKGKGKGDTGKKKNGDEAAADDSWRDVPLRARLQAIVASPFARVTYTEAIDILSAAVAKGKQFVEEVKWGIDLASEHERYLCEVHFQKPTIVIDYPKDIKAFYMRMNDDGKTVAAMDILVPGVGELIGGSQREERADVLADRMRDVGLEPEDYSWYLDLRRYGTVPHSGFGAGFERLVCYTTGINNIRDSIPFPRYPGHCEY